MWEGNRFDGTINGWTAFGVARRRTFKETTMLYWTVIFLVVALVAALLGLGGIASSAAGIAQILFLIFIVLFVISLIMQLVRKGGPSARV